MQYFVNQNNIKKLQFISFEYLLASFCKWHFEDKKFSNIEEFNSKNKITLTKALLYPFFACIGNGSFKLLFNLFGDFYAQENGPISSIAIDCVLNNKMLHLKYSLSESANIKVEGQYNTLNDLINEIENTIIDEQIFKEIKIEDSGINKKIKDAIDKSISNLKEQTGGKFITYEKSDLITLARQHDSWDSIYSYYKDRDSKITDFIISPELADMDRKVYRIIRETETIDP